jgi:hypothetical protein
MSLLYLPCSSLVLWLGEGLGHSSLRRLVHVGPSIVFTRRYPATVVLRRAKVRRWWLRRGELTRIEVSYITFGAEATESVTSATLLRMKLGEGIVLTRYKLGIPWRRDGEIRTLSLPIGQTPGERKRQMPFSGALPSGSLR